MSHTRSFIHRGDCHCGRVQFEFESEPDVEIHECNCSICYRVGFQHLIIPATSFKLQSSWDELGLYTFNTGVAKHYFCQTCGVKPFYIPRSNPDGVSVNFRCVDPSTFNNVTYEPFDGRNWEQNAGSLAHLSK